MQDVHVFIPNIYLNPTCHNYLNPQGLPSSIIVNPFQKGFFSFWKWNTGTLKIYRWTTQPPFWLKFYFILCKGQKLFFSRPPLKPMLRQWNLIGQSFLKRAKISLSRLWFKSMQSMGTSIIDGSGNSNKQLTIWINNQKSQTSVSGQN